MIDFHAYINCRIINPVNTVDWFRALPRIIESNERKKSFDPTHVSVHMSQQNVQDTVYISVYISLRA